jgi:hypothetical protein
MRIQKEVYKVHQILLEMSNLLLILEQEPKMASLAKELIESTTTNHPKTVQ